MVSFLIVFALAQISVGLYLHKSQTPNPQLILNTTLYGQIYGQYIPPYNKGDPANYAESRLWHRSFRGLPFAKPPVGNLRFASPIPYERLNGSEQLGLFDAREYGKPCYQLFRPMTGSENCLYANVNIPHSDRMRKGKLLPVVVWVFGGGYYFGDSNFFGIFDPRYILSKHDVIFVSFNHRVSIFGFYNGSYGYDDVVMALQWTRENIHEFGGDPNQITVMGISSGATMISHLLVDTNAPLFKRAWMISPPLVLKPKSYVEGGMIARKFQKLNNCFNAENATDCMRKRSAFRLLTSTMLTSDGMLTASFSKTPVKDTMFWSPVGVPRSLDVVENPSKEVQKRLEKIDVVIGNTQDEIAIFTESFTVGGRFNDIPFFLLRNSTALQFVKEKFFTKNRTEYTNDNYEESIFSMFGPDQTRVSAILQRYPPKGSPKSNVDQLMRVLTSYGFHCTTRKYASHLSEYTSTRLYEFQYAGSFWMPVYGKNGKVFNTSFVSHAADEPFYFNSGIPLKADDKKLAEWMVDLVQAYVSGSNLESVPDPAQESNTHEWPEFNKEREQWMVIGNASNISYPMHFHRQECDFWNELTQYKI